MKHFLNLSDIQGYILRGYHMPRVRHFILKMTDIEKGRAFIGSLVENGDVPQITSATEWPVIEDSEDKEYKKPLYCLNIGLTFQGLKALALPGLTLSSFALSPAFIEGPVSRAPLVGDTGHNAPEHWDEPLQTHQAHILLSLYADGDTQNKWNSELEEQTDALRHAFGEFDIVELCKYDGEKLQGENEQYEHVHFGFRDGISQPLIEGSLEPKQKSKATKYPFLLNASYPGNPIPPGAFLFGYSSQWTDFCYPMPEPAIFGMNGSFAAFRVLEQDVKGFQDAIQKVAEELDMSQLISQAVDLGFSEQLDAGILSNGLRQQYQNIWSPLSSSARVVATEKTQEWRIYDKGKMYVIQKEGDQLNLCSPEQVAAKICGRWFNGSPLAVSKLRDFPLRDAKFTIPDWELEERLNNFDYLKDPHGYGCPFGAHIRRTNPRTDPIAGNTSTDKKERSKAADKRRIIRRGMPYGPEYTGIEDGEKRGLLGLFIGVSLEDQFEFLMSQWVNAGGFNGPLPSDSKDPLIGNHSSEGELIIPTKNGEERLQGLSRFVTTRGGLYCFLPSISALKYIALLPAQENGEGSEAG